MTRVDPRASSAQQSTSSSGGHVIITGGSSGIGLAFGREFVRRGERVSIIARDGARAAAVADEEGFGWAAADVGSSTQLESAIADVERIVVAPVTTLVCSAGIVRPTLIAGMDGGDVRDQLLTNYLGSFAAAHAVLPGMLERGSGTIIFISSTASLVTVPGYVGYGPTKAAVNHLARALRAELRGTAIRIVVVYPPDTRTPGFEEEVQARPPETALVAGSIKPIDPDDLVQRALARIQRGHNEVAIDITSRMLLAYQNAIENLTQKYIAYQCRNRL